MIPKPGDWVRVCQSSQVIISEVREMLPIGDVPTVAWTDAGPYFLHEILEIRSPQPKETRRSDRKAFQGAKIVKHAKKGAGMMGAYENDAQDDADQLQLEVAELQGQLKDSKQLADDLLAVEIKQSAIIRELTAKLEASIPKAEHNKIVADTITALDAERTAWEHQLAEAQANLASVDRDRHAVQLAHDQLQLTVTVQEQQIQRLMEELREMSRIASANNLDEGKKEARRMSIAQKWRCLNARPYFRNIWCISRVTWRPC